MVSFCTGLEDKSGEDSVHTSALGLFIGGGGGSGGLNQALGLLFYMILWGSIFSSSLFNI